MLAKLVKHEVIVPLNGLNGKDHADIVRCVALDMADSFGNARQSTLTGYSFNASKEIAVGDVAVIASYAKQGRSSRTTLRRIAALVLDSTEEDAVLIADGRGAELVKRK